MLGLRYRPCYTLYIKRQRKPYLYSALLWAAHLWNAQICHVLTVNYKSHRFTCHPHVYPHVEWTIPVFTPHLQTVAAFWLVLKYHPLTVRDWVGLGGLVKYWRGLLARRRSPIPVLVAAAGNRTRDSRVASPTTTTILPIGMPIVPFIRAVFLSRKKVDFLPQMACFSE